MNILEGMMALISPEYREQQRELHATYPSYGNGNMRFRSTILDLARKYQCLSILDYGCGRGGRKQAFADTPYLFEEYDPAFPGKDDAPEPADLVICSEVLEHVEPDCLPDVLFHLAELVQRVGFFTIPSGPAMKILPDGRNAHLTQQPMQWWLAKLNGVFNVVMAGSVVSSVFVVEPWREGPRC